MKENKAYRSEAAAAIHETAAGLFDAGVIDKQTVRDFDETCLTYVRATDTKDSEAHPVR